MKRTTQQSCAALLAGLLSLPVMALTSGPDARPRPEDYPSYSLYLQALFDYQRAQHPAAAKTVAPVQEAPAAPESLEDAIANAGHNPGYIDTSAHPRSTFKSFALTQIPSQDMSQNGVADSLGIFGDHELDQPPRTTARLRPDNDLYLIPDVDLRLLGDTQDIMWQELAETSEGIFGGYIELPENGWAYANASVSKSTQGDHGIDMTLSSRVRSNVYILDRDGMPGTPFDNPGVVAIRPLSLTISGMHSHITTFRDQHKDDLIAISTSTQNPLLIDLSGSRFGTAATTDHASKIAPDRSNVGPASYFAAFGDNAMLTIAGGTQLDIKVSHPDGLRKPLATVNGKVPTMSLGNFRLIDQYENGEEKVNLSIGKTKISGLDIANLRLYLNKATIVIDLGTGVRDMSLGMEQVAIGNNTESSVLGDLYIDHVGINNSRISIAAH